MSDYISREALKEAFDNADADVCESFPDGYCDWGFGRQTIRDVIASVPTADVEPVRHGRWKPLFESEITGWNPAFAGCDPIGAYVCSCCNSEATYTCDDEFDLSNYCPNCGAKMCLEDEDAERWFGDEG